jgi:hypothetical protein
LKRGSGGETIAQDVGAGCGGILLRVAALSPAPASPIDSCLFAFFADVGQGSQNVSARGPVRPSERVSDSDPLVIAFRQPFVSRDQVS